MQGRSGRLALFNLPVPCGRLRRTRWDLPHRPQQTRATGRDHERADRRQARRRPADPAAAAGQAGNAGAVVRVGCSLCRTPSGARSTREPSPASTVLVARRGQIGWFDAIGRQSPAASAPMAHDTIFRIFSMTKPIVSIGIMMLLEDGHFLLNDPVAKFIPEFSDTKGRRREPRQARTRAGATADDHPGSVAPHLGPDLRPHRQRPRAAALQGSRGCAAARSPMPSTPPCSPACR